ncbi:hypothetical protein D3C87_2198150 [compost metagenome]
MAKVLLDEATHLIAGAPAADEAHVVAVVSDDVQIERAEHIVSTSQNTKKPRCFQRGFIQFNE